MSNDSKYRVAGRVWKHFEPVLMQRYVDLYSVSIMATSAAQAPLIEALLRHELRPILNPVTDRDRFQVMRLIGQLKAQLLVTPQSFVNVSPPDPSDKGPAMSIAADIARRSGEATETAPDASPAQPPKEGV